jgi:peptidoglycan glycosyltransferase
MLSLIFLQDAAPTAAQTLAPPEKQPALLSLIYIGGFVLIILLLLLSLVRNRKTRSSLAAVAPMDLPEEVRKRLGVTSTNRGLRALRWLFVLISFSVFGFHVYWAHYAEERNASFQQYRYVDLRNKRLVESSLRGWILPRVGDLDDAIAYYTRNQSGNIVRDYSLEYELSHLLKTDRGNPGLERSLFNVESSAVPEAWQVVRGEVAKQQANRDVRLSIDVELQKYAREELKKLGKPGAVVMINPQTGDILTVYSEPTYSVKAAQDEMNYLKLDADKINKPLLSRALDAYYIPGSTFKTLTMIAAFLAGEQGTKFTCQGGGYVPMQGAKALQDDGGHVHGTIGIETAYEKSCNQYFAQMGVKLGAERLRTAAKLVGIGAYDTPGEALRSRKQPEILHASSEAIKRSIAPTEATMVTGPKTNRFELALEGFGQGQAGQMTPFQMAMLCAAIANLEGKLMKAKIEKDLQPEAYSQAMTPQQAQTMRDIMGLVPKSGTGRGAFAPVNAAGITSGGKTGTAQKEIPVVDPKTGKPKTETKYERDYKGNIIRQYEAIVMALDERIDSWYLCIAPLEHPTIAMAVIIEGGGYGSRAAAPLAAKMILKAKELGLLSSGGNAPSKKSQEEIAKGRNNGTNNGTKQPARR